MKTSVPEKVQLIFHRDPKLAVDLPSHITVAEAALYILSQLPKDIQREVILLVDSDKNGALKVPKEENTYAAKTRRGYGVIYESSGDKKSVLLVVHPADLARFKTMSQP